MLLEAVYQLARMPMGLAGSILYLSSKNSGENITQIDIAEAAGVTEVTIRNRFKSI